MKTPVKKGWVAGIADGAVGIALALLVAIVVSGCIKTIPSPPLFFLFFGNNANWLLLVAILLIAVGSALEFWNIGHSDSGHSDSDSNP